MSTANIRNDSPLVAPKPDSVHKASSAVDSQSVVPIDNEADQGVELMHIMQKRVIGGLYAKPELVKAALAPSEGRVPRILDIGVRTGEWAIAMAKEFPQSEIIGLDLNPPVLMGTKLPEESVDNPRPSNIRLEAVDVNLALPLESASVDLVHASMVDPAIADYRKWLSEVTRVMRPGAVFLTTFSQFQLIGEDGTDLPTVSVGEPGYTGLQSLMSATEQMCRSRWGGVNPTDHLTEWMEENGYFESFGRNEDSLHPIGLWKQGEDENSRIISELTRRNGLNLLPSFKPILLLGGHDERILDQWIQDATRELSETKIKALTRWTSAWGTRSTKEWEAEA